MRAEFTYVCTKVTWRLWAIGYFPYRRRVGSLWSRPIYSFALGPLRFVFMDTRSKNARFSPDPSVYPWARGRRS
jgi:hypothetical protein